MKDSCSGNADKTDNYADSNNLGTDFSGHMDTRADEAAPQENLTFRDTTSLRQPLARSPSLTIRDAAPRQDAQEDADLPHTNPCLPVFAKWIVMVLTGLLFLLCLTVSKLSLVHMGDFLMDLRQNATHDSIPTGNTSTVHVTSAPSYGIESTFLMMVLIIMTPFVTTLVRSIWSGAFRQDRLWPSRTALAWCILASVLESGGLTLFTVVVLSETIPYISVLLMNGVFLVHILVQIFTILQDGVSANKLDFTKYILAFLFGISGVICTGAFERIPSATFNFGNKTWAIPLSLVSLSIAWSPYVQRAQLYPNPSSLGIRKKKLTKFSELAKWAETQSMHARWQHTASSDASASTPDSDYGSTGTRPSVASTVDKHTGFVEERTLSNIISAYPEYSARWKSSIISNALKILLIPAFGFMYGHALDIIAIESIPAGFSHVTVSHPEFYIFIANLVASFTGYLFGWLACILCMQKSSFAIPLILATPVSFGLLIAVDSQCDITIMGLRWNEHCGTSPKNLMLALPAAACLYIAQLLSTGYFVFQSHSLIMQKESQIFWLPGYTIFLEQWLLLGKKTKQTDESHEDPRQHSRRTRVYICTTMYREAKHEMEQLLQSLSHINQAKQESDRHFQAHIFFDNGVREKRLTDFALQLVSVTENKLGIACQDCTKVQTPYGLRLTWQLPTLLPGKEGMVLSIHLKDNFKVKNKKRWSQVMYMSYVLDYFMMEDDEATDEDTFILTTDADVQFRPESVEALLDLMTRDIKVGAVCARTYPMGSGPIVWYQIFDYAIGHWLQKVSNHILGTVLCCPGCFSVYRAEALRQVLPVYASKVTKASQFLTKDMGEDRWLCTLMVQSGWRLEYCAAAENSTYCPEEFDEFFKQRRRWIPSTLANLVLLIQEWKTISRQNKQISVLFLLYQAALLVATLISPSMCLLVITGGLYYAWNINQVASVIILILIMVMYTLTCLSTSQETQLMVGKLLTVVFSLIMAAVVIGTAIQISGEVGASASNESTTIAPPKPTQKMVTTSKPHETVLLGIQDGDTGNLFSDNTDPHTKGSSGSDINLPISVTTLYLAGLVCIFLVTGLLHLPEIYCLVHGIWYLLCLPAGYLVLIIYSVCNITDRSWGTREDKSAVKTGQGVSQPQAVLSSLRNLFMGQTDTETFHRNAQSNSGSTSPAVSGPLDYVPDRVHSFEQSSSFKFHYDDSQEPEMPVTEWLPRNFRDKYAEAFFTSGYENTSFLAGMTEKDLRCIGVSVKGHRKALLQEIKMLSGPPIDPGVPETIEEWLNNIGLSMYRVNFHNLHIFHGKQLEVLKTMTKTDIKRELGITKQGHLHRLMDAINKLRYPTDGERDQTRVKQEIDVLQIYQLADVNTREHDFWESLKQERLLPDSTAFSHDFDLKEKLQDLRNSTMMVFAIVNTLWIILIMTLVTKSQLDVLGTNALGLSFLVMFGVIVVVQFLCMLCHRVSTWLHLVARAPYCCGAPYNTSWSFHDDNLPQSISRGSTESLVDPADLEALRHRDEMTGELRRRYRERVSSTWQRNGSIMRPTAPAMATVEEEDQPHETSPLLANINI